MELRREVQRRLRSTRDWPKLIEELEHEVAKIEAKDKRALALGELGDICDEIFLRLDRAVAHYEAAFQLDPRQVGVLERAYLVQHELGDLAMAASMLARALEATEDPIRRVEMAGRLGIALMDLARRDDALVTLEQAHDARPDDVLVADAYAAASYDPESWEDDVARLLMQAGKSEPATAARIFLRVARILHVEAPAEPNYEDALRRCLAADPGNDGAALLLENLLGDAKRWADLFTLQEARAQATADVKKRARLYRRFAVAWRDRWKERERAAHFWRRALEASYAGNGESRFPGHLAAFGYLREVQGARGEWGELLTLADLGLQSKLPDEDLAVLATQAGLISWREMKNAERAKGYFAAVKRVYPESEELRVFMSDVGGLDGGDVAAAGAAATAQVEPKAAADAAAAGPQATGASPVPATTAAPEVPTEQAPPAPEAPVAPPAPPAPPAEVIPEAVAQAMAAARGLEGGVVDKAIEAWRKVVTANPTLKAPRTELARVLRGASKWNALVELWKEIAEKLGHYTPDEKVAVMFDLIDIYRDQLKLDVMVVNTYNAILVAQPGNIRALDALATQYENMKRWPDLIAALQKKAAVALGRDDQIALYSRIANLFQEKFSNAAEAIKAYEKVLDLDPQHTAAITFLKGSYEKRRDWEKLIGVHQREIERISDGKERGARFVEVAKLASEKLKKPAVSIELWSKVVESQPDHPEALAELEKLYEREKVWDKLADVCERQAASFTDVAKKVAMLQKLGILFTDKVSDPGRATRAWRALLDVEPENKRAQDAIKKLYLAQKSWPELEAFYAAQNKYDEYVRVLERQVETEDAATKVTLSTRIAELYRDKLGKAQLAVRAYEKVLSLEATNMAAAEALIPLYEQAKDPKKLVGVLEIQLGHTKDHARRSERLRALSALVETQLRDKATAYQWTLKAFAEDRAAGDELSPDRWSQAEAERLARETNTWPELVAAYEAAYTSFASPHGALALMATVARVYEEELKDIPKALATSQRILTLDDNNQHAIGALERLYVQTQQFPELLKIYEKKLSLEMEPQAQKEIRYRIASLFEEELKDPKRAIDVYGAILAEGGDELPALQALDRIFVATQQWRDLSQVISRELAQVGLDDTAANVELKFRLGRLREEHLNDVMGAIECFKDILDLDPQHAGARGRLEARLGDEPNQLVAAGILEPIYLRLEEWRHLVEVHEIQLRREKNPGHRVSLLLRIGELEATRLGDGDKAFNAYSRCFREDPANETAIAELYKMAQVAEKWADLVALFESAVGIDAAAGLTPQLQRELLLKIADAYDVRLGKPEKAVEFYKRAQAIEPDDMTAIEALEKLYQKNEKWPELLEVYKRKVDLTPEREAREELYFQIAYLWEEMLQNLDEAIVTYKDVLGFDDGNLKALKALDRLYQVKQAWHELADNLSKQLALTTENTETIPLLVRLAHLREQKLGEVAAAVDTYSQVLNLDPDSEQATTALERLIAMPEHEQQVAMILEPIYQANDRWIQLVGVYEIMVRHALDPGRKIELLHRIGELYEVGGDDGASAFKTYERALREDAGLKETQTRLERLARALERWADLVNIYKDVVVHVGDEQLAVLLWTRVAQLYETQLAKNKDAAEAYMKVLGVDPHNLAAADALEALYLRDNDYARLVEVVLRKVEMLPDVQEKKTLCFRAAQIYEEVLDDAEKAIGVFRTVLSLDENDLQAIDALERLYIRLGRWDNLKDIYRKKAELAPSLDEKKQMFFVLGQVYDKELKDLTAAIETYQMILELDPEDYQAIQALDRLYGQAGRWYDLLQILEREVELSQSTGETASLKHRIGQLWEKDLKDLARAVEAYREVLGLDAGHEPTLKALDGIVHGANEPVLAAEVLERVYETAGDWEELIDVYEVMVRHADNPGRKVELLHRIAGLYERNLERMKEAFQAYGRAFREDSQNDQTLAHLERLAMETEGWADAAALYEEELKKLLEPSRQVEMLLRTARVYEEELEQVDKAIFTFRRVLEADQDQRTAIDALDRLYEKAEKWAELADILKREIRQAQDAEEIISLQFRLGQIYEASLHDVDHAIEQYREILVSDPGHGPTLAALELLFADEVKQIEIAAVLEPLYRASEQWDKLTKINEVQLARLKDPGDRLAMLQRMAEICEQRLNDLGAAFHLWGRALREAPSNELAGEEVERLGQQSWDEVVALYTAILAEQKEPDTQRRVLLKVARVYVAELHEAEKAEECYHRALGIDPRDSEALAALDKLYESGGMWSELAEILGRRIGVTSVTEEIVELYFRLGRIYSEALDAPDHAITSYNAILEIDSRNAQALECLERVYFQREQWADLFGVYEKMVDIAQAVSDDNLADCFAHMAKLASDALNDPKKAIDLWSKVVDIRGEDPTALYNLQLLYEAGQQFAQLVDVIERQIRITNDAQYQIARYADMGRIQLEKLGKEKASLEAWQQVLNLDPGHLDALRAVAHIYKMLQEWEPLVDTLQRLIEVGTTSDMGDAELIDLYSELGRLQGEILMRPQEAIDAWKRVLILDGNSFPALGALETLYTQEARWEECIEIYERKATVLDDAQAKIAVLLQAAELWKDKLDTRDRAANVYERVLAADNTNLIASRALEEIYRANGTHDRLIELLLQRTEFVGEAKERIELFQDVARLYEHEMGDQEGAFVVLQAAFKEDYSNNDTSADLERLATTANKWGDLLTDYTQVVQQIAVTDTVAAANLWVKIGRWYGEHLGHLDYAIASEQQALQLDPNQKDALTSLAEFYRKKEMWTDLSGILAHHASIEADGAKRVELYLSLAELFEGQLADAGQAIGAYRLAVQADANCLDALKALERLYRAEENWPQLIDVLERKSKVVIDNVDEVLQLKHMIGSLWEVHLNDPGRAIITFKEVMSLDSQNVPGLKALERLYERTGEMNAYLQVLEQQLDIVDNVNERTSTFEKIARTWEQNFHKPEQAWDALEKILQINERHEPTLRSLERLYRQERRFELLVDTYRRHINVAAEPSSRVELYAAMGEVYETELKDLDRAIEAYTDILAFDPDHTGALGALGRLYERIGDWNRAIDTMDALVNVTSDQAQRVDLHHRIGRIYEDQLKDPDTAEHRYVEALSLDPGYVPAMTSLTSHYQKAGDWLKAAQMMIKAEAFLSNPIEKERLLYEAGRIYWNTLHDEVHAGELFARVLELDPEHAEAGEPLADLYFRESTQLGGDRWRQLEPILDMLVRKTDKKNSAELNSLYYRLAMTSDMLGNFEKALKYYKLAYDLDPTHLPTLLGRANLLYKQEDWDGAFKIYQTILINQNLRDSQKDSDIVEIFFRLGNIKLKLAERKKALNMFEKALELDPTHRPTLLAIIDLQAAQNDFEAVIQAKRALANASDEMEQFKLFDEIGDLYREKIKNPHKAIEGYLEALRIQANNHAALQKVLELYYDTTQWKKVVEVLQRFVEIEKNPLIRGKYYEAGAKVLRDELKSHDEAIEYFNKALDCFFEKPEGITPENFQKYLRAFEAIDKICTSKKDWKNQERNWRKMLKRLPQEGHDGIKITLWHNLGEIYRSRLREYASATSAFEVAAKLDPNNMQRHEILAELYVVAGPDYAQKAVNEHMILLRANPQRYESFKALHKLYMDLRQYDKAWCMCSALNAVQRADADQAAFYEQYKQKVLVRAKNPRISDEMWSKLVLHPDQDRYIGAIFGAVWQAVALAKAAEHKQFGLKRKEKLDLNTHQALFTKVFTYVAQVCNVPIPEVYLRPEQQTSMQLANTKEKNQLIPSLVVGAEMLQGRSDKELAFPIAQFLTKMRAEHYLKLTLPTNTELRVAFLAALKMVQPTFPLKPADAPVIDQYTAAMRTTMQPQWMEQLAHVVSAFMNSKAEVDLNKWSQAVELTAQRVGFVLCNDLLLATRYVSSEPTLVGGMQPKDKAQALLMYAISEQYFELRAQLGITIS